MLASTWLYLSWGHHPLTKALITTAILLFAVAIIVLSKSESI